jgi:hypothetical protein
MLRIAPRIAISVNYKYSVRGLVDDIHAGFVTSGVSGDVAWLTEALRAGNRLPEFGDLRDAYPNLATGVSGSVAPR